LQETDITTSGNHDIQMISLAWPIWFLTEILNDLGHAAARKCDNLDCRVLLGKTRENHKTMSLPCWATINAVSVIAAIVFDAFIH
jgi:hypothetical protein